MRLNPELFVDHLPDAEENKKFGIVVPMTHSEAGLAFLPMLREQGIKVPVMAPNTWSNLKFLSDVDEKYTKDVYLTWKFPFVQLALRFIIAVRRNV